MRADGLFGGLVVHAPLHSSNADVDERQSYEEDTLLLVGDWYHRPAAKIQDIYDTWSNWGMEPAPDSLLINGRGTFDCSRLRRVSSDGCLSVPMPGLLPRVRTSRVRIVNTG